MPRYDEAGQELDENGDLVYMVAGDGAPERLAEPNGSISFSHNIRVTVPSDGTKQQTIRRPKGSKVTVRHSPNRAKTRMIGDPRPFPTTLFRF